LSDVRYVVGDIHGCLGEFERLLEKIGWQLSRDKMWLVGDIVNRGPDSLGVLRWAYDNRDRVQLVLGNHDLHLLARWAGVTSRREEDSLTPVLAAPDIEQLMTWLRRQPLAVQDGKRLLVHSGVHPHWDIESVMEYAAEVSGELGGERFADFLERLYHQKVASWTWGKKDCDPLDRACAAAAIMTRIRMVKADGDCVLAFTGPPGSAPRDLQPWFTRAKVIDQGIHVYFGHWAHLGFTRSRGATCVDSGCVYGGSLSAVDLSDGTVVEVPKGKVL